MRQADSSELQSDRVALKDQHLVYRACSTAFARSLGKNSPDEIIGKTDFDIFPRQVAREQMALDSQTIFSAQADISAINLAELDMGKLANQANNQATVSYTHLTLPTKA